MFRSTIWSRAHSTCIWPECLYLFLTHFPIRLNIRTKLKPQCAHISYAPAVLDVLVLVSVAALKQFRGLMRVGKCNVSKTSAVLRKQALQNKDRSYQAHLQHRSSEGRHTCSSPSSSKESGEPFLTSHASMPNAHTSISAPALVSQA